MTGRGFVLCLGTDLTGCDIAMTKFEVRRGTVDDGLRLVDIWGEQRDIEAQLDPRLGVLDGGDWQGRLRVALGDDDRDRVLVALREGVIVGFVWVGLRAANTGVIVALAVDAHDGQGGVGTALLDAAMDWLRRAGVEHLIVEDVPRHVAVQQAFWRAKGAGVIRETLYLPIRDAQE